LSLSRPLPSIFNPRVRSTRIKKHFSHECEPKSRGHQPMFSGCLSLSNVTTPVLMLSTIIPLRLPHHSPWLRYKSYSILPSQSSRLLSSSHQFAKTKLTRADRDECESKNYETLRHGRACRSARCADLKYRFRGPHDQHRLFRSCYFASVSRKYENLVASVWMIFSSISNLFVYKRPNSDS